MKKLSFAALLAACALSLAAQEVADTSALTMSSINVSFSKDYVLKNFEGVSISSSGSLRGATRFIRDVSTEERQVLGSLDGDNLINKPNELIAATAVLNIKDVAPVDALKTYAEIAMEGAINKFFGVTDRTHDEVLKRLKAKYNFSNAEINSAIHAVVDPVVDKYYSQRGMLDITPSIVYAEWKRNGVSRGLDGLQIVKDKLAAFYFSPTPENFAALVGILVSCGETEEKYSDPLAYEAGGAFYRTLKELSNPLWYAVISDSRSASAAIAAAGAAGKDLGIFSLPYAAGGR
jgi:hypothetical protein